MVNSTELGTRSLPIFNMLDVYLFSLFLYYVFDPMIYSPL